MRVDLNKLQSKGRRKVSVDAEQVAAWSNGTGFEAAEVCADLNYVVRGQRVRWEGSIGGRVSTPCGSCGASVCADLSMQVGLTLVPEGELAARPPGEKVRNDDGLWGYELGSEAAEETGYDGPEVDLASWLEDEWRLGLPALLRCTDCECRGAAAQSEEAAPTIDPRWAGLQALREQMIEDRGE
jgi:uncharacterized metal-binding protein YceD (DUF177 family)